MGDLFEREQRIYNEAALLINGQNGGFVVSGEMYKALAGEYGLLLNQLRKIVKISDKASVGMFIDHKERKELIAELENELLQKKIAVMLSQIQPHFLYNVLSSIRELCLIDPGDASRTIEDFSEYLRANLDSLSVTGLIPFEQELRHVEIYLALEKKRFGDRLHISRDIQARGFMLPPLTLQPIMENAVQHGVTKRAGGGTVSIATTENESGYLITVADDGVGFDASEKPTDGRSHIGIENVRSRLGAMCSGTLTVHSEPGCGTTAVIFIPR